LDLFVAKLAQFEHTAESRRNIFRFSEEYLSFFTGIFILRRTELPWDCLLDHYCNTERLMSDSLCVWNDL